ncbi:MAG: glycosyltransferase [Gemmataceae bacterium]
MRIAILAHGAPQYDAVGNQVAEKVAFFQERGAEVRLFLHTERDLPASLRPLATTVPAAPSAGPVWTYLAGCDLVVAEFSVHFPLLDVLPLLARERPKIAVDYHGVTPPEWADGLLRQRLEESRGLLGLVWFADGVLVHSRYMRDDLAQATGYPPQRVLALDLPIDDRFRPDEVRVPLGARLGLKGARLVLFVGRMAANKRPDILIEALALLKDEAPATHGVFVGYGADAYAAEVDRLRHAARALGVADRAHFLGQLDLDQLADAYRSADMLVLPSRHEGFGIPLREAMACGLPVIAARTTALPETLGDAGLTFAPDDACDLARQMRRVFDERAAAPDADAARVQQRTGGARRVALVCFRFGAGIVGGAERSLRTIGAALRRRGVAVEVFTTCNRAESAWRNELAAGTFTEDDLVVHRFPIDPHDRERHLHSLERLRGSERPCAADVAEDYLRDSVHSTALLQALERRIGAFDALIAGPYLFGLTADVARRFPDKTLLLPCFHDEPLAWLPPWPRVYGAVAGVLYHSDEEQEFAQTALGLNHPNAGVIGTWLPAAPRRDKPQAAAEHDRAPDPRRPRPAIVYCGRYTPEKNVALLLEQAARYRAEHPDRFDFIFMGAGSVRLPGWVTDLGQVDERRKAEILRAATALAQLSERESLSLVILEAWREGTPVIVNRNCAVLRGQVERSGGGFAVDGYAEFAAALDRLWNEPGEADRLGRRGQAYVEERYLDQDAFAGRILDRIEQMSLPLREQLRRRGLERAERSRRATWRTAFGAWIEGLLDEPRRALAPQARLEAEQPLVTAPSRRLTLLPVRIDNHGPVPLVPRGPARTLLCCRVVDAGCARVLEETTTELSDIVLPGRTATAAILVRAPREAGEYRVSLRLSIPGAADQAEDCIPLKVETAAEETTELGYLTLARQALAAAHEAQRLPDDYVDVTEGWFARLKRWLKRKLLGNFKRAYVDVLSRQQSAVNRRLVDAVRQLTSACGRGACRADAPRRGETKAANQTETAAREMRPCVTKLCRFHRPPNGKRAAWGRPPACRPKPRPHRQARPPAPR